MEEENHHLLSIFYNQNDGTTRIIFNPDFFVCTHDQQKIAKRIISVLEEEGIMFSEYKKIVVMSTESGVIMTIRETY